MATESVLSKIKVEKSGEETTGIHMGYLGARVPERVARVYPWALSEVQSWGADHEL